MAEPHDLQLIALSGPLFADWTQVVFAAGLATGFFAVATVLLPISVTGRRRIFWLCWAAAAVLLALSGLRRGVVDAVMAGLAVMGSGMLYAFYTTPFIKVAGRVWTFWITDAREDPDVPPPPADSYLERVTAPSMWWTLAGLGLITGGFALSMGWLAPVGIMAGALLAAPLAAMGHLDRKDRYPIARERYFPFAIVVLSSVPTLLWPVLVYFAAYYMTSPRPREDAAHEPFLDHDS
ncbi:hypothetical protein [Mycolicibacterium sp. P1-5]|uniref:hypothetical protein n=1 Tax=Mycolicibacterium sp. P1-5 TaxID=2024617 RepID=UPI0011EC2E27|nr:hypothetical protein [Mycolicibacterium sp. P1-5]KAA0110776.1 hypothetical protein CIW47_07210 [Mycolicibacterium sp. P1-5]